MSEVFTWVPDWISPRKESVADLRERDYLGRSGGVSAIGADFVILRQDAQFTLAREAAAEFVAFWEARRGAFEAFDAPSMWQPGMASDFAPHVFEGEERGLVRFSGDELECKWVSGNRVQIQAGFVQTIRGSEWAPVVFLYRFALLDGSRSAECLTEWGSAIEYDGVTWRVARIQHEEVTEDLNGNKERCELELDLADSDIMAALVRREISCPVSVEVLQLDLQTGAAYVYFSGWIVEHPHDGNIVSPKVAFLGDVLQQMLPAQLKSRTCTFCLFSGACNRGGSMTPARFSTKGRYVETWPASADSKVVLGDLEFPSTWTATTQAESWGYFVGGWAETGSGARLQKRQITFSAWVPAQGVMHIIPLEPFLTGGDWMQVGDEVRIFAGCDGNFSTCQKFGNGGYFGGQPHTPAYIVEAARSSSSGGK